MKLSRGFTLPELMVVIAVLAIALGMAAPNFFETIRRHRLIGIAEILLGDLQLAKSEALKQNQSVAMSFTVPSSSGTSWCYGINAGGAACDCTATASTCAILTDSGSGTILSQRVVRSTEFNAVTLTRTGGSGGSGGTGLIVFSSADGAATGNSTVTITNVDGLSMGVVVSSQGRIRLCSPAGTGKLYAYEDC